MQRKLEELLPRRNNKSNFQEIRQHTHNKKHFHSQLPHRHKDDSFGSTLVAKPPSKRPAVAQVLNSAWWNSFLNLHGKSPRLRLVAGDLDMSRDTTAVTLDSHLPYSARFLRMASSPAAGTSL
eukprot:GHVP01006646.1.p1 GENE.GHVP01006646.1~~GHVP01006646.1.p1  ORF type:complete len:123 (+),score=15.68 GHVP01006646.1:28-396(+)